MLIKKAIILTALFIQCSLFSLGARDAIKWYVYFVPNALKNMKNLHGAYQAGTMPFKKYAFWQTLEALNLHFYFEVHKMGFEAAHSYYSKDHAVSAGNDQEDAHGAQALVENSQSFSLGAADNQSKDLKIQNTNLDDVLVLNEFFTTKNVGISVGAFAAIGLAYCIWEKHYRCSKIIETLE